MSAPLDFSLLGPVEIWASGRSVHVGGPRHRAVLTMLLLERGRAVSADRLVKAVWAEEPPPTARGQVQICVSGLRRTFSDLGSPDLILTRPSGYLVRASDGELDVEQFRQLVRRGRVAAQRHDPARAVNDLRAALSLWRGPALADMDSRLLKAFATRLDEERLAVHEECIGLELRLGRQVSVIVELSDLVVSYPLREKLWAHLMLALYRAGRPGEALAAYRRARETFAEELGLDPGEELRALERGILRDDPFLHMTEDVVANMNRPAVPRQLPSAIPDFVGRTETARQIRECLTPGGCHRHGTQRHVEVAVVGGRSGVGKSALALHVAQSVREHYPDGQLFAHLRGAETGPARPEHVLDRFLRALGMAPALLPDRLEDLAALYRSELADRRILVVLDDAVTEEQVLPFVPGDPGSALVVTSRRALPGLHGAHRFDLDVFSPQVSAALLSEVMGEARVRAEPQAAAALAHACGHLPLALRVAAAKLSPRGHWSIEQMVGRLADEGRRLDELTLGEVGVRASIALSYDGLGDEARRLLMLLGMLGPTDFAHWVAGPLLAVDLADSDDVLEELVQARLVEVQVGVDRGTRFHLHDLIRIFAGERVADEVSQAERAAAQHRLLRCWLSLAGEAHRRENGDPAVLHSDTTRWTLPGVLVDGLVADPLGWFQSEQTNLIAAIRCAADNDYDDLCWDLSLTCADFLEALGDLESWNRTNDLALRAVRRAHNKRGEAALLLARSGTAQVQGRLDDAQRDLEHSLAWFTSAGDVHGRGHALSNLAVVDRDQGRDELALIRLESALSDLRAVRDRGKEAYVLSIMARIELDRGRCDEAAALLREALEVCPQVARRDRVMLTYLHGETSLERGDLTEAAGMFDRVLHVVSELNDPVGKSRALLGLGRVRAARKEFLSAAEALQAAWDLSLQVGDRIGECRVLLALVELALDRDDPHSASGWLDDYDTTAAEIGYAAGSQSRIAIVRETPAGGWQCRPTGRGVTRRVWAGAREGAQIPDAGGPVPASLNQSGGTRR